MRFWLVGNKFDVGVSEDVLESTGFFWLMFVIFLEEGLGTFLVGGRHLIRDGEGVCRETSI
jgi:hypothetical protein